MNKLHATSVLLAASLLLAASCGQDSDIGSPCRFQSTFSVSFPPDAILETGSCVAYEGTWSRASARRWM